MPLVNHAGISHAKKYICIAEKGTDMKSVIKGRWHAVLILISILASLIPIAFAGPDLNSSQRTISLNVSPGDAYAIMQNSSDSVIIDVRTPQEYQSSHLEGAKNMDYYSDGFLGNLTLLDKNRTYIIYCRTGIRGGMALEMMRDLGFKEVYNIIGGITQWAQEGRPMIGEVISSPNSRSWDMQANHTSDGNV